VWRETGRKLEKVTLGVRPAPKHYMARWRLFKEYCKELKGTDVTEFDDYIG
jgi:hypothetical protein